jgi:hypothetical protein
MPNNSSQNATKHGCCSEAVLILKHENVADYKALEATWFKAYTPTTDAEKRLIQQLVNADWFSERATRAIASFESQLFNENPNPADWTEDQLKRLALLTRYQTARANAVIKARKAVEDFRKNRAREEKQKSSPQKTDGLDQETHDFIEDVRKTNPESADIIARYMNMKF